MRVTSVGVMSTTFLGLLPFFTIGSFFYSDINSKFFLIIFFVDLLLLLAAHHLYRGKWRMPTRSRFVFGALLLVLVTQYLSAILGVFLERSLWSDIFWSSGVLFFTHLAVLAVLLAELLNERDWSFVRRAVAVSSGLFGLLTLVGVNGLGASARFLWIPLGQGSLTLGNETYAGAYLLIAFVITLIELSCTERGLWRGVLAGSAALIALSPLLINTGLFLGRVSVSDIFAHPVQLLGLARSSSAALLALLTFICGYLLIGRFIPKRLVARTQVGWAGVILLGTIAVTALLFVPGSPVQQAYIETSSAARPIVWEVSWEAFLARPTLGWGPENFSHAFEAHFDNRVFEEQNLAEIWFERAHNIFLDTLVSVGVVGTLALVLLILAYLLAVYRAQKREYISRIESVLLYALVPTHLLQMQTGFDTIGSYTLLAVMCGYALSLERQGEQEEGRVLTPLVANIAAGALTALALMSFMLCLINEYARQAALFNTPASRTAAEHTSAIEASLARVSSFESLRMSSATFITGALTLLAEAPTPGKTATVLEFTSIYETYFKRYLLAQPDHYRARINYAYLLLIKTALGENRLGDAKELIRGSYPLSPGNPLTYILDSVAELYGGNLKEADRLMKGALAINPGIEFTQEAAAYLERQKKRFPNISVLRITDL